MKNHPSGSRPQGGRPRAEALVRLALVFYGLLFAAALLWTGLAGRPLAFADESAARAGVHWPRDLAVGALSAGVVILISQQVTERTRFGERSARALGTVLGPLGWSHCLVLAAVSGVAEEAFFRGAVQPRFGLVAASLLFGLAHFAPRRDLLPWTVFSIAAGFLLGALFEATGNLVAPIVAHAGINAVNLRFLSVRYA